MSMASAYRMKKRMSKGGYADGGETETKPDDSSSKYPTYDVEKGKKISESFMKFGEGGECYADGGFVDEEKDSGYESMPKEKPSHNYAHEVPNQSTHDDDLDMIEYIMKKRSMAKGYSKGGMVANDTGDGASADLQDNQFDDLVLSDDLDFNYTGANSGDDVGNETHDEEDHDVVSQIMKSRKKKDKLPRPA